jgi:hypothetical protein
VGDIGEEGGESGDEGGEECVGEEGGKSTMGGHGGGGTQGTEEGVSGNMRKEMSSIEKVEEEGRG